MNIISLYHSIGQILYLFYNKLMGYLTNGLAFFLIALLLSFGICQQNPPVASISLGQIVRIQPKNDSILYYKCDINLVGSIKNFALITVETQSKRFISVYSSIDKGNNTFIQYPNYYNNSESCYYSSMDTCVLNLPETSNENKTVTIYFAVQTSETKSYTIQVSLQNMFQIRVNHKYKVDFSTFQSGIVELTGQSMKDCQQVVITIEYSGYQNIGKFNVFAAINEMPNTYAGRINSQNVGAFNQILILDPIPQNSTYLIVLQGEPNTKLDLSVRQFSVSSPSLNVNQTFFYYSHKDISFVSIIPFDLNQNNTLNGDYLPLQIDLASLAGYGTFSINYCNGLSTFDFQNVNGQNGEIFITVEQRQKCLESIQLSGQLLLQEIIVSVQNIIWSFGFSIGIYEGDYPLKMRVGQDRFGTLLSTQINRTYIIEDLVDDDLILFFEELGEQLLQFDIMQCQSRLLSKTQKCNTILTSKQNRTKNDQNQYYYKFTTQKAHKYFIIISHNGPSPLTDAQYLIKLKSTVDRQINLNLLKVQTNIIQQNQYQYYILNLTKIKKDNNMAIPNGSIAIITLIETNGDCLLLTSIERRYPNFQMIFQPNSVVDYSWSGSKQYIVNQTTESIYIGVKGNAQSLYTIQANLNTGDDLPSRYIKLIDNNIQSFTLTNKKYGDQALMMYSSHSIPYNLIFFPEPSCIKYGYSLPIIDGQCQQLPNQFTSKTVYFKVTNGKIKSQYKFSVYVNSGIYVLYENKPILIACQDFCYEIVYVVIKQPTSIIHRGIGHIANVDQLQNTVNNGKLLFQCSEGYPCAKQINATLIYGGSMEIYYQSLQSDQIQWISKPMQLQKLPKRLYMQIKHYADLNTAIFYSEGLSLKIFYNIFRIQENSSNLIEYQYPTDKDYMKVSIGNPLRRLHIVQFDQQLIKKLNCRQNNMLCIATIAVYPNLDAEYSWNYLMHGIGYYSSNTFQYYISINNPVRMSEQYSLSYFTYQISKSFNSSFLNILVRPLSSCHPQILIPQNNTDSHYGYNPYYNNYTVNIINPSSSQIQFAVMVDTACQYYVWLNDHHLTSIVQNIWTDVVSNENGQIWFVFGNQYYWQNQAFTINLKANVSSIMVRVYQKDANGQVISPSVKNSLNFCNNCSSLSYSPKETLWGVTYLVLAETKRNHSQSVIVQGQGSIITLLQNQRQQFMFNDSTSKVTFQYYSNNDFMLYIVTNDGTQRVTVSQLYSLVGDYLIDEYITQNSDPWLKIRCNDRNIKVYQITIQNVVLKSPQIPRNLQQSTSSSDTVYPKIIIHIQETGTIGLNKLYEGIALFDSFVQEDGLNCYQYTTPMIVGEQKIVLDLIFGSDSSVIPNLKYKSSILSGLLLSNFSRLSSGYRLQSPFRPNQTYQFCFSLINSTSIQSIAQEYYLLVEVPSLKHILIQEAIVQSLPSQYEVYQYIAMNSETLFVQLTNCQQKSTLLGSNNYSDILTGRLSQLHSYWTNNVTTIAQDQITQGYYYFAVKPTNQNAKYQIKLHRLQKGSELLYDKFKLNDNKISKAYIKGEEDEKYLIVEMPKLQYSSNINLKSITYNLYMDDLLSSNRPYSSDAVAKCPFLSNQPLKNYSVTYMFNQKEQADSSTTLPTLRIPLDDVPYIFNLTGSVSVVAHGQSIPYNYYYESTTFQLGDSDPITTYSNLVYFILIALIIGGLGLAYIMFRRWKLNRRRTEIAFQMANYNHAQSNGQRENQSQSNEPSAIQSNRRPLNQNTGYSQFAEESAVSATKKQNSSSKKAINDFAGYGQFVDETM